MRHTLLLCFIHGFKGGDDTFGDFPEHLRALVGHALPYVTVLAITYPKYETRGDLGECVKRFQEWLQNKVIDLEVAASTPSPTIEPSVHTILLGHSMGGILAAETLLSIASDLPIPMSNSTMSEPSLGTSGGSPSFIFPHVFGILAFDTPFLGICPGVIAHGAETNYRAASSAWSTVSDVASALGVGGAASKAFRSNPPKSPNPSPGSAPNSDKLLTQGADAMTASMSASSRDDAASTPTWQRWGKYAMFAGAAGAVVAGGAAAYVKRDAIGEGWGWIGSHLEFVGCLAKGEELRSRLDRVRKLQEAKQIGFRNLVTALGKGAGVTPPASGASTASPSTKTGETDITTNPSSSSSVNQYRTFCSLPQPTSTASGLFEYAVNDRATHETGAHMEMFDRAQNPGYFTLANRTRDVLVHWIVNDHDNNNNAVGGNSGSGSGGGSRVGSTDWYAEAAATATAEGGSSGGGGGKTSPHAQPSPQTHQHQQEQQGQEHQTYANRYIDDDDDMIDIDLGGATPNAATGKNSHGNNSNRSSQARTSHDLLLTDARVTDDDDSSDDEVGDGDTGTVWAGEAPVFVGRGG